MERVYRNLPRCACTEECAGRGRGASATWQAQTRGPRHCVLGSARTALISHARAPPHRSAARRNQITSDQMRSRLTLTLSVSMSYRATRSIWLDGSCRKRCDWVRASWVSPIWDVARSAGASCQGGAVGSESSSAPDPCIPLISSPIPTPPAPAARCVHRATWGASCCALGRCAPCCPAA